MSGRSNNHEDNIRAGAEVVIANTYALSRILMRGAGAEDRFEEAMRNAVEAAKAARDAAGRPAVAIAGSISQAVGRDFMFDDRPPLEGQSFRDAYLEQAQMLAAAGVDMLVLEMMTSPRHAPIVDASLTAGLPVWLGVSVLLSPEGDLVTYEHGVSVDDLLGALVRPELAAVTVMHSPLEATSRALKQVRKHWSGPLGAYPESGTWIPPNWTPSELTPAEFAATAVGWVRDDGVSIVGGCCGIGPQFIEALRDALAVGN